MLISNYLEEMEISFEQINEVEVETLGITASVVDSTMCTFVDNERYIESVPANALVVLTTSKIASKLKDKGVLIVDNPRGVFFKLHNHLVNNSDYIRKKFAKTVGEGTTISNLASIALNNVRIGSNVVIEEFVVIRENVEIGDNSIIRAGTVIGGEGFEFKREEGSTWGVKHLGGVKIGANVEIQYNSCIDKGIYPWDDTIVGDGCRIDNLVYIAHGVKLKNNIMIAGGSSIGGRTIVGDNSWIGLGASVRNGIVIGENSRVNMGAVATRDIKPGESVSGNFAIDHKTFIKHMKEIE